HMADGSKGTGDVAGERADVGALGNGGGEGDFLKPVPTGFAGREERQLVNADSACLQIYRFASPRPRVRRLPADLERRVSRGNLFNRAGEARQHGLDVIEIRANLAGRDDLALAIERVRLLAKFDRELIHLG